MEGQGAEKYHTAGIQSGVSAKTQTRVHGKEAPRAGERGRTDGDTKANGGSCKRRVEIVEVLTAGCRQPLLSSVC